MENIHELRYELKNRARKISFDEDTHTYRINGEQYLSVTTLLDMYYPEFDADDSLKSAVALKQNKSVDDVRAEWEAKKLEGSKRGTALHTNAERTIRGLYMNNFDYPEYNSTIIKYIQECQPLVVETECVVYSEVYKIAGTIDFLKISQNGIGIMDWKFNKSIDITSQTRLLHPLDNIPNSNYHHYALQLNMYRRLLSDWDILATEMGLVHINGSKYNLYDLPRMDNEIDTILMERLR